jgi:hypothetical protein
MDQTVGKIEFGPARLNSLELLIDHVGGMGSTNARALIAEVRRLRADREGLLDGLVEHQKHRDAWRRYAYGQSEKPMDFLDGNKVDRGQTEIERLRAALEVCLTAMTNQRYNKPRRGMEEACRIAREALGE